MDFHVVVHDFAPVDGASSAGRLEQGRDLALACLSADRWVTPQTTIDCSMFALHSNRVYQYRFNSPLSTAGRSSISIPEWGEPSSAGGYDQFRLQDLQEFESTDIQISSMHSTITFGPSHHGKRTKSDESRVNKLEKRPRLEASSVSYLIPQPYFIPSPAAKFQPVDIGKIPPYKKTSPSPISPYDVTAVNLLLNSKFRRAAWLIPVRGSLPWGGVSEAVVLEEMQVTSRSSSPYLHASAAQSRPITWTPDSLQHFWTFLQSIQQAKHLGPLSLSFRAASTDTSSSRDSISEPVWESNRPYYYQFSQKLAAVSADNSATDVCGASIEEMDYIKIYHDLPYSLSLRNVLDAYRYEAVNTDAPGRSGAHDRKIRILKGTHLVLMDERSKPVLWM